ncbi:hypothetical protein K4K60_000051 [Colletotrichum sp. SAR11_57]|nr:hypothetical protein K4K60_000051 [Colletotrichum sp. SAR11_57]
MTKEPVYALAHVPVEFSSDAPNETQVTALKFYHLSLQDVAKCLPVEDADHMALSLAILSVLSIVEMKLGTYLGGLTHAKQAGALIADRLGILSSSAVGKQVVAAWFPIKAWLDAWHDSIPPEDRPIYGTTSRLKKQLASQPPGTRIEPLTFQSYRAAMNYARFAAAQALSSDEALDIITGATSPPTAYRDEWNHLILQILAGLEEVPCTGDDDNYLGLTWIVGQVVGLRCLDPSVISWIESHLELLAIAPDSNGHVPYGACHGFWPYVPSFEGNLALAILFGLSALVHLVQAVMYKQRYCWVIIMAGVWETSAFVLRTLGAKNGRVLPFYIISSLTFMLAPLWINAYAYMVGARIVHFSLPDRRVFRIKASYMTKLFVGADLVCFGVQGAGGSMLSGQGSASTMQTGKVLYTAGCIVQLIFIAVFTAVVVQLHVKVRKNPPSAWNANSLQLIWVIYIVLILIFVSTSMSVLKGHGLTHV